MSNVKYSQQGDCLAFKIDKLPEGLTLVKGATIAFGEVTGHNHTFYDDTVCLAEKFDHRTDKGSKAVKLYEAADKSLFAEIVAPVFLRHQEHLPIEFKPGVYRIGIVREYDWAEKRARKIID